MSQNDSTSINNMFVEQNISHSLSNRDIFSISNAFNSVKSELSQLSMDLFFLLVTQVTKEDDELFLYETSLAEIQRKFERRIKKESIQEAGQELFDINFEFKIGDKQINTTPLSIFEYDNGTIRFKLNSALMDIVINQKTKYTVASLHELISIKSVYAKRIYLLLKQFAEGKEFIMHLTNIYKILNLENKYKRYSHFKNKILNPAIKSINEQTSLNISMQELTKNRTVQRIKFDINSTKKEKKSGYSGLDALKAWLNNQDIIEAEIVNSTTCNKIVS